MNTMMTEDLLDVATAPAKKSKSTVASVAVDAKTAEKCKRWLALSQQVEDAKTELDGLAADLKATAEPLRRQLSKSTGKMASSVNFADLQYQAQNVYTAIPAAREEALRAVFGERFTSFFVAKTELEIDVSLLVQAAQENDEVRAAWAVIRAAKVGNDSVVTGKKTLKPTTAFHDALATDDSVFDAAQTQGIRPKQLLKESK